MGTIRKRGDKWSYRVDLGAVNGKRVQKEKGGFATKKEAAAAMTLVENELLKTGEYVEAEQKITMQQLYEEFKLGVSFNSKIKYGALSILKHQTLCAV